MISKTTCLLVMAAIITMSIPAVPMPLRPTENIQDPQDSSPEALWEAAHRGELECMLAILESGVPVDSANAYGSTALAFAADQGHVELVRSLLQRGADPNTRDTFYGFTPLLRAIGNRHGMVARLLVAAGAAEAPQALILAVELGDLDLVRAIMNAGQIPTEVHAAAVAIAAQSAPSIAALLGKVEVGAPAVVVEIDPAVLNNYVGAYRDAEGEQTVTITLVVGRLVARINDAEDLPLAAIGEADFLVDLPGSGKTSLSFGGRGGTVEWMMWRLDADQMMFRPVDLAAEAALAARHEATEDATSGGDPVTRSVPTTWSTFRGPDGTGIGDGQGIPTAWNIESGDGVRWRTGIPGIANSSPIIWGDRIFVATAVSSAGDDTVRIGLYGDTKPVDDLSTHSFRVYALDRYTGAIIWEHVVWEGVPLVKRHSKSSQANSTPVTDGEHLVVVFGSAGSLLCYGLDGVLHWRKEIGALDAGWFLDPGYQWGHASSPVIYEGTVILQADQQVDSFIAAYDIETGEELWRTLRDEISTWGTPAVYRGRPSDEVITNGTTIRSYNPRTGEELWTLGPNSEITVGSPIVNDDLVFVMAGYPPIRPIYAIRPGGRGSISLPEGSDTNEWVVWSKDRGGTYIPSPIVYGDYLYTNANNGRLTTYDKKTGELVNRTRIGGVGGSYVASPVAADGRLYFSSEDGTIYVMSAGMSPQLLASNDMNDVIWATPAISDGLLVVRTLHYVYGIGDDP